MNKLIKFTLITLLFISQLSVSAEKSTLLLSSDNESVSFDFLNVDKVTAMQFDIVGTSIKNNNKLSLKSCLSGLAKTHQGTCQINKEGNLRITIFSSSNAELVSGNIGKLKLVGNDLKINNVVMGTADLQTIKGDIVLDMHDLKAENKYK